MPHVHTSSVVTFLHQSAPGIAINEPTLTPHYPPEARAHIKVCSWRCASVHRWWRLSTVVAWEGAVPLPWKYSVSRLFPGNNFLKNLFLGKCQWHYVTESNQEGNKDILSIVYHSLGFSKLGDQRSLPWQLFEHITIRTKRDARKNTCLKCIKSVKSWPFRNRVLDGWFQKRNSAWLVITPSLWNASCSATVRQQLSPRLSPQVFRLTLAPLAARVPRGPFL